MSETSLSEVPPTVEDSMSVPLQLLDVEILYLLSSQPAALKNLVDSLKSTFDLSVSPSALFGRLRYLERAGKLKSFQKHAGEGFDGAELYGITFLGSKKLGGYVDSLSEIALTMQLGFNQRLLKG